MSADFIITITDRSRSGEFGAWLRQQGAALVLTALGKTEEELLLHRYSPYYPSFAAFKRQLIARNKDIQLLDE